MKILTKVISLGQALKSLLNILSEIFHALNTDCFKPQNVLCLRVLLKTAESLNS